MIIAGAGLAGLIAGHIFPHATIIERGLAPVERGGAHKALLRFRSDAVSLVTGVPFRKVTVHKGIWDRGALRSPSIALANQYSLKVTRRVLNRSIWDLAPATRYVAPVSMYEQLVEQCRGRLMWGVGMESFVGRPDRCEAIISTIPMPAAAALWLGERAPPATDFKRAPIRVQRARIPGADVFQTVYFPSGDYSTYRASITGDTLIVESMSNEGAPLQMGDVLEAFGLAGSPWVRLDDITEVEQQYGKIEPIDEAVRRSVIFAMTQRESVYSVGRFATWRNILLDDVVQDLRIVKSMLERGAGAYERALLSAG